MNIAAKMQLKHMLIRHEVVRLKPYRDTLGKLTIGVGRCLDTKGITNAEAMQLLDNDIADVFNDLMARTSWFRFLDPARQVAMCDMAFNLGINGVLNFHDMCAALERKDYNTAAKEMLDSLWHKQVGKRAEELAEIIKTGKI